MKYILVIIIECLLTYLFKVTLIENESFYELCFVVFNSFLLISYFFKKLPVDLFYFLLVSYCFRVGMLWFDLYAKNIFYLPHSGSDTEAYYNWLILICQQYGYWNDALNYSKLLSILSEIFSTNRLVLQYINVIFGMGTVFCLYKILEVLQVNTLVKKKVCVLFAFMPNLMIFSSILLRESIIIFLFALSVYYFCKWMKYGCLKFFCFAQCSILLGSYFHIGIIGSSVIYCFMFICYFKKLKKIKYISLKSMVGLPLILILFLAIFYGAQDSIEKFNAIQAALENGMVGIGDITPVQDSGSLYLQNLIVQNLFDLIWQVPIRAFYFQFSPMLWNVRNIMDIIAIIGDVIPVLISIFYASQIGVENRYIKYSFIGCIVIEEIIFGLGTVTSGTAIRHRNKYMILFFILLALGMHQKVEKK